MKFPSRKPDRSLVVRAFWKRTLHRHVARSGPTSHLGRHLGAPLALLTLLLGCGGSAGPHLPDAGPPCTGPTVCDGILVRACNQPVRGEVLYDCLQEGACSRGRCISPACAAAEVDRTSFAGCVFYTVQADNVASDAAAATSCLVTNPGAEAAKVELQQSIEGGTWSAAPPVTVAPRSTARLSFADLQVDKTGTNPRGALRITSNRPITVAQIESDDANHGALSSAGTMLLPEHVLGNRYRVMTYPQAQTQAVAATAGGKGGAGRLLVVGTKAGTTVTMTLPKPASVVIMGSLPSMLVDPLTFTLNEGEVFQALSGDEGDDLSGTEIRTTFPVAVFSGNITTSYGRSLDNVSSPDMVHEQMPPLFAWSFKYVAAALPPQAATCDTLLGQPGASLWRVISATDGTRVDVVGPSGPIRSGELLEPGQVMEFTSTEDLVVSGTGPLLMTQGIDCEPSLSLAISADKLLKDLTFGVLPSFDQMAAIARKNGDPVMLDGVALDEKLFVSAGSGYQVARVALPACPHSDEVCTHRLQGRFGMTLRGMDVVASYALTAPAWAGCIDMMDPACLN